MGLVHQSGWHLAGLQALIDLPLTVEAQTPTPIIKLVGNDADGTATEWEDAQNGTVLDEAGAGALIYDVDHGGIADGMLGVTGDGANRFVAAVGTYGVVTTESFIWELVCIPRATTATAEYWVCMRNSAIGWFLYADSTNPARFFIQDASGGTVINSGSTLVKNNGLSHIMGAAHRAGNFQFHIAGQAGPSGSIAARSGSLYDVTNRFTVFDRQTTGRQNDGTIFLFQMWLLNLSSADISATAKARAATLYGQEAALNVGGSTTPTSVL